MIKEAIDFHSCRLLCSNAENNDPKYFFEMLEKYL